MIFAFLGTSFAVNEAFAQSQIVHNFDLGWKIKAFIDDFREGIAEKINPEWGATIRMESTQIAQAKLEELLAQGKPVPDDLFQRVQQKIDQTRPFAQRLGDDVLDTITVIAETNEIRKITADFQSGQYSRDELQARINALDSVQEKCVSVPQVADLENYPKSDAYKVIQEKYCPVLQNYDASKVLKILNR